jgi:hypothetical protein
MRRQTTLSSGKIVLLSPRKPEPAEGYLLDEATQLAAEDLWQRLCKFAVRDVYIWSVNQYVIIILSC